MKTTIEEIKESIDELRQQIPELRRSKSHVVEETRSNPIPYAVTGIGVACAIGQAVKSALEKPKRPTVKDRVASAADSARHSVVTLADEAKGRLQDATEAVSDRAQEIRSHLTPDRSPVSTVREIVREKPFLCGAGVLATGFVAGLLMPASRVERRWLGDAGRQVIDDAKAAGAGAVAETKAIAKETIAAADAAVQEAAKDTGEAIREKFAEV